MSKIRKKLAVSRWEAVDGYASATAHSPSIVAYLTRGPTGGLIGKMMCLCSVRHRHKKKIPWYRFPGGGGLPGEGRGVVGRLLSAKDEFSSFCRCGRYEDYHAQYRRITDRTDCRHHHRIDILPP